MRAVLIVLTLLGVWTTAVSIRAGYAPPRTQSGSALAPDYGNYRPHFQGFGTSTTGGSGRHLASPFTTIYHVTSLSNRGPGTLRECVEASGPRVCVFDTSGTIALTTSLQISDPYITIACQTAPSPGIAVRVYETFFIRAHDVVIQHCWHGNAGVGDVPGHQNFYVEGQISNVVLDHVTATGATHNNIIFLGNTKLGSGLWQLRAPGQHRCGKRGLLLRRPGESGPQLREQRNQRRAVMERTGHPGPQPLHRKYIPQSRGASRRSGPNHQQSLL
jgi:hypothetical protein